MAKNAMTPLRQCMIDDMTIHAPARTAGTPLSVCCRSIRSGPVRRASGQTCRPSKKKSPAWEDHRNKHHAKANWQFTSEDACLKLKRLYPSF